MKVHLIILILGECGVNQQKKHINLQHGILVIYKNKEFSSFIIFYLLFFFSIKKGGQEVFYPSHQFFLTSQSIYLVVFDISDPKFDRIDYWMNQLRSTIPHDKPSPILIIGTHLDSVQQQIYEGTCDESYLSKVMEEVKARFPRQR